MRTMYDLVDPEVHDEPLSSTTLTYAARTPMLEGARLTLIDNGKAKAKELLLYVGEILRDRLSLGSVEVYSKGQASRVIDQREAEEIAAGADYVIAGVGDCGACSACSLADAIKLEQKGVPSTVLISDVFIGNVAEFSRTIGLANYHCAVVPHPVSSKSEEILRAYAQSVIEVIAQQLTADPRVESAGALAGRPAHRG